jgi:YD repeat-containing protein
VAYLILAGSIIFLTSLSVSDGESVVQQTATVKVLNQLQPPQVLLEVTPSFPVLPGQKTIISVLANGIADIASIQVKVDGAIVDTFKYNAARNGGDLTFSSAQTGRHEVEVLVTDLDGLTTKTIHVVKVKDPLDTAAPVVAFDAGLHGSRLTTATEVLAKVVDSNLDEWQLEIGEWGRTDERVVSSGYGAVSNLAALATLDPQTLVNGFYRLKLSARDISGRTSVAEAIVEVNTATKSSFTRQETDLTVTLGDMPIALTRQYDASTGQWTFGYDPHLQVNVAENAPLTVGSRLYLTMPSGERLGFTFAPAQQAVNGNVYYTPNWIADGGGYTLASTAVKLMVAGGKVYDLATAVPYHPGYTLTALDDTKYELDAQGGLLARVAANGGRLIYSDSGITGAAGAVQFTQDGAGRITKMVAPNGAVVSYGYDAQGHLVSVRNSATGKTESFGYDGAGQLQVVAGETGIVVDAAGATRPIQENLLGVANFNGRSITLTNAPHQTFTFNLKTAEISGTSGRSLLLAVEGAGDIQINGLAPVYANGDYRIFAVDKAGVNLLDVADALPRSMSLRVIGDVNGDSRVDGLDSQLVTGAFGVRAGDAGFNGALDLNRDGVVDAQDLQLLGGNYGFMANSAPVITPGSHLTHVDLTTRIDLSELAIDQEGDKVSFFFAGANNGRVELSADGQYALFTPNSGLVGTGSFDLIANDGYSSSRATIAVQVSDAALVGLKIVNRNPKLEIGEKYQLQLVGDFTDQKGVEIAADYFTYGVNSPVVTVDSKGLVTALTNGTSIITATYGGIKTFMSTRVGTFNPSNQQELNVSIAEARGLSFYPQAVTLVPEMTRQILVGIDGIVESPDLRFARTGTNYFVSNPNVIQVSENGLITAINPGEATISVINGMAERLIPVKVELPHLSSALLNTQGGAVQSLDGSLVTIAPGSLSQHQTVSIKQITQSQLPLAVPEKFNFAGAFQLEVGNEEINHPAQIAIPNKMNLAVGTEVFFLRQHELPQTDGTTKSVWVMEESGKVGGDDMIRTASPPWKGATNSGTYTMVVPKFAYATAPLNIPVSWYPALKLGSIVLLGGAGIYTLISNPPLGLALGAMAVYGALLFDVSTYENSTAGFIQSFETLYIPRLGLPYKTSTGVSLNLQQLSSPSATFSSSPNFNLPDFTPSIERSEIGYDEEGVFIKITGRNFTSLQPQTTTSIPKIDELRLEFNYGITTRLVYNFDINASSTPGYQEIIARIPNSMPVSDDLSVNLVRSTEDSPNVVVQYSSATTPVYVTAFDRVLTANPLSGNIYVLNAKNAQQIVDTVGSANLALAVIPLGSKAIPRYIASTADRAYVPLENGYEIAIIDPVGLRELDADTDSAEINRIRLNIGSNEQPSFIVIGENGRYAYVSDKNSGSIYVVDIDPASKTYHKHVKTISIPGVSGIKKLAVNSTGKYLFIKCQALCRVATE